MYLCGFIVSRRWFVQRLILDLMVIYKSVTCFEFRISRSYSFLLAGNRSEGGLKTAETP